MRDFAQELVDLVIDNVAATGKSRDIGSCGAVCRRWLPRSRMHLFSQITLSNSSPATIPRLINLVDASPSNILSFVQTLDIHLKCRISEQHMARLERCCSALRELRICFVPQTERFEFDHIVRQLVLRFGGSCPALTRVELDIELDIPLNVVADLITSLPGLTHLRLSGPPLSGGIYDPATILSDNGVVYPKTVPPADILPPSWHSLDISLSGGATLLFQWLLSHSEPPTFTSLKLAGWVASYPIEPVCSYFRRFGSQIESLSLAYCADRLNSHTVFETRAFEAHALATTPRLVELKLVWQDPGYIPALLTSISSVHLTTLRIGVILAEPQPDWLVIDTVLATSQFGSLRNISFTHQNRSLISPELKLLMPHASARNILAQI
ncbi:hypothetical protein MSAN_00845000 [Mycena sanguinolenta]|uniref:Uncharacterized protein n=1 Tax=Mycena sanguinolenta TaxID=230812 RepID=A0A8H6YWN8_9AGAR|nr:hypothetical protein MSAN_00845000 [Mycena sanguinolenta]